MGAFRLTQAEKTAEYHAQQELLRRKQQATMQAYQEESLARERLRKARNQTILLRIGMGFGVLVPLIGLARILGWLG